MLGADTPTRFNKMNENYLIIQCLAICYQYFYVLAIQIPIA
ncbi:hypothetical protein AO366_1159 [Moraxella catarrhalis]|uniref:Uncharacterized protein n=1 Tax=Moraxella catarrhalis TaxID=480 RepID=A0A198WTJ2_MORCA|nr:hypothetical protein AO384_0551 [Moraxella catarrhalis]OAU98865.1 hypothetical protein AO383_0431 [Moraxella catarrhalis]OAV02408.1 hypothetical protein AO381_1506 [Moraxella catarrhalis]OAV04991.1 hypothetical protein AO379_1864 [Moraxella catarrhalis]OAV12576.1 hypothetical protein AO376_1937 [Moraxella catarrhalis]